MNKTIIILLAILLPIIIGIIIISSLMIYSDGMVINSLTDDLAELNHHHESLERAIDVLNILHTQIENERLGELMACQELLNQCK